MLISIHCLRKQERRKIAGEFPKVLVGGVLHVMIISAYVFYLGSGSKCEHEH